VRKASEIARGIAKSQQVLSTWEKITVINQFKVSPGPRNTHYVVVQLQDDPAKISAWIASFYSDCVNA
jgi:hypothetical protein